MREQRDGAGNTWRYAYGPGRTVVTDPLGHSTSYEHDLRFHTVAVTDPLGAMTRFSWDDGDRLVAVALPLGDRLRFAYDRRGNLVEATRSGADAIRFEWDDNDNLDAVVSASGDQAGFAYDDAGRTLRFVSPAGIETRWLWRSDGLLEAVTQGDGGTTRYGYDDAGHLASVTDPLGATTTVRFDAAGRPGSEVHPGGARTDFTWDALGRLMAVTDATGTTTGFDYDRSGLLVAVTNGLGHVTRYGYEERGLLASVTDPLGRITTFTYDPCGRLETRTDPRGATVHYRYDATGRLTGVDGGDLEPITYTWDREGRLTSVADGTGTTTFDHDQVGRPIAEGHDRTGIGLTHGYDQLGRRVDLALFRRGEPLATWHYGYDPDGRITLVVDPTGGKTSLAHDPAGRLTNVAHPNGVTTTWSYDSAGQPTGLTVTGRDGILSEWILVHDADGNRTRTTHCHGGGASDTTTYQYDELGRLLRADSPSGSHDFAWDRAGNRLDGPTMAYDPADQLVTGPDADYRHDAAGNLTERLPTDGSDPRSCDYDGLGRPVRLTIAGRHVTFAYDGLGRRVARTDDAGAVLRVYDGASVVAEADAHGNLAFETSAGLLVLARHDTSGNGYLHPDPTTSIGAVTGDTGAVVARFTYTPFGRRTASDGDASAAGPLGFCGAIGVREEPGGILDMRARFYDSGLGRFMGPDPWPSHMAEPLTLNHYLYALGDPVSQVDPYGLFCWTGKDDKGKCRGLNDVVEKGVKTVRGAADFMEEPLGVVSVVATGVAAVAAGTSLVCPPCAVVTGPVAGFAGTTAYYTGIFGTAATCIADGLVTFDCAVSSVSTGAGSGFRRVSKTVLEKLGLEAAGPFARGIFGIFRHGVKTATRRIHK